MPRGIPKSRGVAIHFNYWIVTTTDPRTVGDDDESGETLENAATFTSERKARRFYNNFAKRTNMDVFMITATALHKQAGKL